MRITNPDQIVKKGLEFYEAHKEEWEKEHLGEFVAINVESGEFSLGPEPEEALRRLKEKYPESISYLSKIGPERGIYTLRTIRGDRDNWNFLYGFASH